MPPTNPRKRPAPGSSPAVTVPQIQQAYSSASQLADEQFLRWSQGGENTGYSDTPAYNNMDSFNSTSVSNPQYQSPVPAPSNQIARRPVNRALVASAPRPQYDNLRDPWATFGDDILDAQANGLMEENGSVELLEERAAIAKREAQSKRKQIPPFVQKLSSFLDESKNTDLIRWSDRGDSFIVVDEDEFAKTLIPELFKHNNYASFVRQLNMYGFHKRVGLSDNSMKASERKNKSPSEYYNPFFKRGHPNLLWLINKPKGGSSQKKAKGTRVKTEDCVDGESDDEGRDIVEDNYGQGYGPNSMQNIPRAISTAPDGGPLQRRDMAIVQHQLQEIQKQQSAISTAISRLRKDHNQLYQQAVAFQTLHDRHESSINAILTFLATVYNRSLDGQGAQNIAQLFANAIPQDQQQGNVVNICDVNNQQQQQNPGNLSPHRRAQRLLMPPPVAPPAATPIESPMSGNQFQNTMSPSHPSPRPGAIEELFETPPADSPQAKVEPHNIMNIINNSNAQVSRLGAKSFPDLLNHFENANGNSPITSEQRNNMLNLITSTSAVESNNAIVTSSPPAPPSLEKLGYTQAEIDELVRMQQEQEAKLGEVSALIQPLSPSGSIPGLNEGNYFHDANASPSVGANIDLDQFLDAGAYYTNGDSGDYGYDNLLDDVVGGNSSFDFNLDGANERVNGTVESGRIVETGGSSNGSSPTEIKEDPHSGCIRSPIKKRRKT